MKNITLRLAVLLALFLACSSTMSAQGLQNEFGKNRVQHHDDFDEWQQYETPAFITYWYGKARPIGQIACQIAEAEVSELQQLLEYRTNDKIEIIVYTDLTDLKQSNIGGEESFVNVSDETKVYANKVFIHFDGNHQHLRRNIREGITGVYLNAMLYGGNIQEVLQNAVMLNLPNWYKKGIVAYAAEEWNPELDNQLRDIILKNKYTDFSKFAAKEPLLAGHAFWYFIGQNFGKSTVSNLLYLTRINRNIESGFIYVLGGNVTKIMDSWMQYFRARYDEDTRNKPTFENEIKVPNRKKLPITEVKMSPNGRQLTYVQNEIGRYKVYIYDLIKKERKLICKGGFRNNFQATDYNYPLVAWKPNGHEISVLYERRDILKFLTYDTETQKSKTELLAPDYQRVYNMSYISNSELVFSATTNGFSDIFIYKTIGRTSENITNDFYDDLYPALVTLNGRKGIVFSSNRPDTLLAFHKLDSIMPLKNLDLFYYGLDQPRSRSAIQLTHTPELSETRAMGVDSTWFSYLSDESGIADRKTARLDTVIAYYQKIIYLKNGGRIVTHQDSTFAQLDPTFIDSTRLYPIRQVVARTHHLGNHNRSIITQSIGGKTGKIASLVYNENQYRIYQEQILPRDTVGTTYTYYKQMQLKQNRDGDAKTRLPFIVDKTVEDLQKKLPPPPEIDPKYKDYFQSEFLDTPTEPTVTKVYTDDDVAESKPFVTEIKAPSIKGSTKFRQGRIISYRYKFRFEDFSSKFDNSQLFGGLNSYAGNKQDGFAQPPLGLLLKGNIKEIMENYELQGGIRIPTTINGSEYFAVLDNRKHRWDKRYAYYRQSKSFADDVTFGVPPRRREITNLAYTEWRYPLDIFNSFRFSGTFRMDQTVQLSTDSIQFKVPTRRQQRIGLKADYVFDNTLDASLNIKNGTRAKFSIEVLKKMQIQLVDNAQFKLNKGFMTVLSMDVRHYQRLDKRSVLAFRLAGATTFGSEGILFYLGGVDQGFNNGFDNSISVPKGDFAYQTFAAQMRGFRTNIRNGQSYLLLNTELRVPFMRYIKDTWRNGFLGNLQAVGFFDTGTAWHGLSPFGKDNPLNTVVVSNPLSPISIKVNYFRDPIIAGVGYGLRTTLFGYFIKVDRAWGIETRTVLAPVWHFSIGSDF